MVDAIVGNLLEKLVTALVKEGQSLLAFDERFEDMKKEVEYMQGFLKKAERVDSNDQLDMLRNIMNDSKELLYDTDDIIAACEFRLFRQQQKLLPMFLSPSAIYFRYNLGKRLQVVNNGISRVKERMGTYLASALRLLGPSKQESPYSLGRYSILFDEDKVVGQDDDAKKIIGWVLEVGIPFQVIGIAGMGGVGKTTLAEKIIKNKNIIENFDHVLFVSISQQVDLENVIKKLLRKLQVNEGPLEGDTRDLLERLKNELNGQRYLIVLDDVWRIMHGQGSWWLDLESSLPKTYGSCVIVTSRNDYVIKQMGAVAEHIHHPKVLSDEDSWLLFSKIAFARNGGECPDPKLKVIAEEIVKKCAGLPLAIKTIGGTMLATRYDVDEWDRMLKHLNAKSTGKKKDDSDDLYDLVNSTLELSYKELPSYLKPCLLCFAAFPEDADIEMTEIIFWWIGEGFIGEKDGRSAMDIGLDYLAQLLSRSLIIGDEKSEFERYYVSFKVHDIIREMLIRIAREENFIGLDDTGRPIFSEHSRRAVDFNFYGKMSIEDSETNIKINPKLRVLVSYSSNIKLSSTVTQKLRRLQWLRILHVQLANSDSDSEKRKGLQFIMKRLKKWKKLERGQIHSLRLRQVFLSLPHLVSLTIFRAGFDEIPDSIGRLHNLKILVVFDCENLLRVSPEIATLKKLIILEIEVCPHLECIPRGIGNLSGLQSLAFEPTNYLEHKHGCRLTELKDLTRLHRLSLDMQSAGQIEPGELNALAELSCLHELHIESIEGGSSFTSKLDQWLSCPLPHLSELNLFGVTGKVTPTWLNPKLLPNLRFLKLDNLHYIQFSQEFWENREGTHWKLEGLNLENLYDLDEEWPRIQKAMPLLTFLSVQGCSHLKSLPFDGIKGGIWRKEEKEEGKRLSGQMHSISGSE